MLSFVGQSRCQRKGSLHCVKVVKNQASREYRFLCLTSVEVVTQGFVHICPVLPT